MKTILLILLLLISSVVSAAQVDPKDLTIVNFRGNESMQLVIKGNMTIREAFEFLTDASRSYQNKIVIKDGQRYVRFGFDPFKFTFRVMEKKDRNRLKPIKLK
jgi:hypothetical protein